MPIPAMIPILMAGFGAARLVAPKLAQELVKKGIGKQVSKGVGRPISKVDDLPSGVQNLVKNPKAMASHKGDLKFAAEKAVRQSEGAKKSAATIRAARPKTQEAIEATKLNKALAIGRKKTKQQRDELVPSKDDPDKFDKMMRMMDAKDKLARQAITGKRKAGGKVKGYKKGGAITYRMTGGQVVDNSYD